MANDGQPGGEAPFVLRRDEGGVRTLTLNRGERMNPLSLEMIAALERELDALAEDRAVRAVVLAGAGRGFCAAKNAARSNMSSRGRSLTRGSICGSTRRPSLKSFSCR